MPSLRLKKLWHTNSADPPRIPKMWIQKSIQLQVVPPVSYSHPRHHFIWLRFALDWSDAIVVTVNVVSLFRIANCRHINGVREQSIGKGEMWHTQRWIEWTLNEAVPHSATPLLTMNNGNMKMAKECSTQHKRQRSRRKTNSKTFNEIRRTNICDRQTFSTIFFSLSLSLFVSLIGMYGHNHWRSNERRENGESEMHWLKQNLWLIESIWTEST